MKKIIVYIGLMFLMVGCVGDKLNNISSQEILKNINKDIVFKNENLEDLKKIEVAERYGIAIEDIEHGIVYTTLDKDKSDRIIIAKASSKNSLEGLERALGAEVIGLTDSWKNNENESEKIEKHIFKTKDTYVLLAISDEPEEIEKIFDDSLEK